MNRRYYGRNVTDGVTNPVRQTDGRRTVSVQQTALVAGAVRQPADVTRFGTFRSSAGGRLRTTKRFGRGCKPRPADGRTTDVQRPTAPDGSASWRM